MVQLNKLQVNILTWRHWNKRGYCRNAQMEKNTGNLHNIQEAGGYFLKKNRWLMANTKREWKAVYTQDLISGKTYVFHKCISSQQKYKPVMLKGTNSLYLWQARLLYASLCLWDYNSYPCDAHHWNYRSIKAIKDRMNKYISWALQSLDWIKYIKIYQTPKYISPKSIIHSSLFLSFLPTLNEV